MFVALRFFHPFLLEYYRLLLLLRMLLLRILYRFIWFMSFGQAIVECLIIFSVRISSFM